MTTTTTRRRPNTDRKAAEQRPPALWVDFAMLGLGVVAVVLLAWLTFLPPAESTRNVVRIVDYSLCGIFAVEFVWQWHRENWRWKFPLARWYDIVGMVPVTSLIFRSFRLLRIVYIAVRLLPAANNLADQVTKKLTNRFLGTIIEVIKRPITVAVLSEVADVLRVGTYCQNIADALEENHAEMDDMIIEMITSDPQTKRVRFIPFHDDIIRLIADTVFRMLLKVLADDRTDELVADVLRNNIDQIRDAVHKNEPRPEIRAAYEPRPEELSNR